MKRTNSVIAVLGIFLFAQAARADWTPAKRITWTEFSSLAPAVAADSNSHIHMVWQDDTNPDGVYQIYYKKSMDGGGTWSPNKRISWASVDYVSPEIAIDSGNVIHVVWYHLSAYPANTVYYRKSTDGGAAWSATKALSGPAAVERYVPAIAIGPSDVIGVVWSDETPGNQEIYYRSSTDGGITWSAVKRLTWMGSSTDPMITIDSLNRIHIVWEGGLSGNYEIYHKKSTDGGLTWSASKRVTWTSGHSYRPAIVTDSSHAIHVIWEDWMSSNAEIYYKRSVDGGTTWSAAKRLTWTSGWSGFPDVAADSTGYIHAAWFDNTLGQGQIYHKMSQDGGLNWGVIERLTWDSGSSNTPSIAINPNNAMHVVWSDSAPGNSEIYYRRGNWEH